VEEMKAKILGLEDVIKSREDAIE